MKSLRKNNVEAQVEFTLKVMERARVTPVIDVSVKKNSLFVMYLNCSDFWRVRCCSVMVRERNIRIRKVRVRAPRWTLTLRFSFFLTETLSITGQKFSQKSLRN